MRALRGIRFSFHNQLEYESYIFMGPKTDLNVARPPNPSDLFLIVKFTFYAIILPKMSKLKIE
jgi:hypothetical protein